MDKKVTMQDVANSIGLSKSLVSRALAEKSGISEKTRALIKCEAEKLGYVFKTKDISKTKTAKSIAVIMPRTSLSDTGFGVKVIDGVESAITRRNMKMILILMEDDKSSGSDAGVPPSISNLDCDGVIILADISNKNLEFIQKNNIPIVLIDLTTIKHKLDHVLADNYMGMYEATRFLIDRGHKNIAFVGHPYFSYSFTERYRGCKDCIAAFSDRRIQCHFVTSYINSGTDVPYNQQHLQQTLDANPGITAILCINDPTAFAVCDILKKRGLSVPQDVSLVGFDNVIKCTWIEPNLTSVNVPKRDLGEKAVTLLMDRIQNPDKNYEIVHIGVNIVQRESVRNLLETTK